VYWYFVSLAVKPHELIMFEDMQKIDALLSPRS
jgi:hypothetical protein